MPGARASHPGQGIINLELTPESVSAATNQAVTVTATISQAAPTGGIVVHAEHTVDSDDTPTAPDATCTVAQGATSCTMQLTSATSRLAELYGWIDTGAGCEADRALCGSSASEGPDESTQPGAHAEPDNTDVVIYNVGQITGFTLDCTPDVQKVAAGTQASINCVQRDNFGVTNAMFPIDAEIFSVQGSIAPNDADQGNVSPADSDGTVGEGSVTFLPATTTASVVTFLCAWLDTDKDNAAAGTSDFDGSDCANEAVNAAADDADFTDVVCVATGTATCPTGAASPSASPSGSPVGSPSASPSGNFAPGLVCPSAFAAPVFVPGGAPPVITATATDGNTAQAITLTKAGPGTLTQAGSNPAIGTIVFIPTLIDWIFDLPASAIPGGLPFPLPGVPDIVVTATDNATPSASVSCKIDIDVVLAPGLPI